MTFISTKDYLVEVGKGNVPGQEALFVIGIGENVTQSYTDVWDVGGNRVPIIAPEAWELFSADAADTVSGTGARVVQLRSLDDNFDLVTDIIITNGAAVAIPGLHQATRVMQVVGAGSNNVNVGDLQIRRVSDSAVRQQVSADEGRANNSFFMVPAGRVGLPIQISYFSPKNEDARLRPRINIGGLGQVVTSNGFVPLYQSTARNEILATAPLPEESLFWFQARTDNETPGTVVVHSEWLIVDAELTEQAQAMLALGG